MTSRTTVFLATVTEMIRTQMTMVKNRIVDDTGKILYRYSDGPHDEPRCYDSLIQRNGFVRYVCPWCKFMCVRAGHMQRHLHCRKHGRMAGPEPHDVRHFKLGLWQRRSEVLSEIQRYGVFRMWQDWADTEYLLNWLGPN